MNTALAEKKRAVNESDDDSDDDCSAGSHLDFQGLCTELSSAWDARDTTKLHGRRSALREALTKSDIPIQQVMDHNYAEILIGVLNESWQVNPKLCFEALWAVLEITCGEYDQSSRFVELGILRTLSDIISRGEDVRCISQAIGCLTNISTKSPETEAVMVTNVVQSLPGRLNDRTLALQIRREYASLAKALCEARVSIAQARPIIAAAAECISREGDEDSAIVLDCLAVIRLYTDSDQENAAGLAVIDELGVLSAVYEVGLNESSSPRRLFLTLRIALGFACSVDAQYHLAFVKTGGLTFLARVLESGNSDLMRYACWAISGLAFSELPLREALIMHETLLPKIVDRLEKQPHLDWRSAILNIFVNLVDQVQTDVLTRWQARIPIFQVLLNLYTSLPDPMIGTARHGLCNVLKQPAISRCIREMRTMTREPLWSSVTDLRVRYILSDDELDDDQTADLIWLILVKDIKFVGDSMSGCRVNDKLRDRIRGLHAMTMLLATLTIHRHHLPPVKPWLTLDLWRLMWQALFY